MDVLKPAEKMVFDSQNVTEAWRRWEQQFRVYMKAAELKKARKRALQFFFAQFFLFVQIQQRRW